MAGPATEYGVLWWVEMLGAVRLVPLTSWLSGVLSLWRSVISWAAAAGDSATDVVRFQVVRGRRPACWCEVIAQVKMAKPEMLPRHAPSTHWDRRNLDPTQHSAFGDCVCLDRLFCG